jgi:dCMP deaminase
MDIYTRPTWDQTFMDIVEVLANRSLCIKLKTSAIIVDEHKQILSIGYNGTFKGCIECDEHWKRYFIENNDDITFDDWIMTNEFRTLHKSWSVSNEIHAESNALRWLSPLHGQSYTLYTLYSPCDWCAKDIISHRINRVVYKYLYKNGVDSLKKLSQYGVVCEQIKQH